MTDHSSKFNPTPIPVDISSITPKEWEVIRQEIKCNPSPLFEEVIGVVMGGNGTPEQVSWAKRQLV